MRRRLTGTATVGLILLAAGAVVGDTLGAVLMAFGALAFLLILGEGLGLSGPFDRGIDAQRRTEFLHGRGGITRRDHVADQEPDYDEDAWARARARRRGER